MSFVVDNDYQTSLLFKQFVGVAASRLDDEFSVEKFKSVPNIFSSDVMIEEIPNSAPIKISGPNNLDVSSNWLDSSCNYATNTVEESTYIGSGPDYGKTFAEIYPDTNLKFYKRLSLVPCDDVNGQGRVWGSFTDYNTNNQSVLKHTIPFKYDDVTATYLPVVRYNKIQSGNGAGTGNPNFQIGNINASPLYWVMDAGTGFLQFYNTTSNLQSAGVKDIKLSSVQDKEWAPVISCYVYNGKTGITNLDISGQQQVADISGENARLIDIERMVLPDGSANPIIDLSGNDTIRAQYEYIRKNLFIGYPAHPVITGNQVDHAFDPSHNSKYYEFDVSGSAYISNDLDVSGNIDVSNNLQVGGNTDVSGNVTIDGNIDISNNISIGGDTDISGTIIIDGGADISGNLQVGGNTDVSGNITIDGTGDISGNLQVGGNTDVSGNITIDGTGDISGNLQVGGNTDISGNITIDGSGDISGNLQVGGNTDVSGNLTVDGILDISSGLIIGGDLDVSGNISVDGDGDISGNLQVGGNTDVSGNIIIDGAGDISGNLQVGGNTDVSGNIVVDGDGDISGNLQVSGNTDVSGNITIDGTGDISGNLQVGGNTDISGNIIVDGFIDISGNLQVDGNTDVSGNITIDGEGDISGNLQVGGNTDISGNIVVDGDGDISGNLQIGGNIELSGNLIIDGQIIGIDFGSGTINSGGYEVDNNGNFSVITSPAEDAARDISGIYFNDSNFDVSFSQISGNNLYVDLKAGNVEDVSRNILFFDPPKAVTNEHIDLITTLSFPRLDVSWNNPTQYRVAFDFIGTNGPRSDINTIGLEYRDEYNFLPYFQGLKVEYLLYDTSGSPVSGTKWTPVPQSNLKSASLASGNPSSYWNGAEFLPKFIKQVFIYTYTSGQTVTDLSHGTVIFNDWNGSGSTFPVTDKNGYAFALPQNCPNTSTTTNGKKVQLRVAMMNRARASITDPSYISHQLSSTDVSWNWVYIPDISGMAIGNYGAPTAPLTFTTPATNTFYDQFTFNGQNDNDGNDTFSANPVVEKELFTPFSSLDATDPFFPKVRYRYDLSGHRLSTSKQVGGYNTLIDISRNLPPTDVSANWFPSSVNPNANPNTWTDVVNRSRNIVYPQHKYEIYGYSMRYNFDPSRNDPNFLDYTDASLNSVITGLSTWTTTYPTRNQATNTNSNSGYRDTLPNFLDPPTGTGTGSTTWTSTTTPSWNQSNYFVAAGAIQAWNSTKTIKTNLLFLDDNVTIKAESDYKYKLRANPDNLLGIDTSGGEIIRMRSNIYLDGTTTKHATDLDLSGVQTGFQAVNNSPGLGYDAGGQAINPSNQYLEWNTTDVSNVYDLGDSLREGGYYCGLEFQTPKIKDVKLTTYPDVSNNPSATGYQVVIYQELSGNPVWVRHPTSSGGWTKIFNPALRPANDIEVKFSGNTFFILNDGYDGTGTYEGGGRTNKFKFGSTATTNSNPTKNFFGLPMLADSSIDIIDYQISLEGLDLNWWPTNNNLLGNLKLYVKGTNSTGVSGHINWNNQTVNKPWSGAGSGTNDFPKLDSNSNPIQTLTRDFDFNGTTTTSFGGNNYSRDLMDTGYSPDETTPMFYIEADYDNNILRSDRGGSDLEAGTRRSLDTACGNDTTPKENRFEGKGVGPTGSYTLFWDFTFNTAKIFQNVGEIGSTPYDEYPFCKIGTSPNFATTFSHSTIMSGTIANKQLMWAKDGFKHGQWSTASENPYINYTSKYWFGNHTPSALAVDYSSFNTTGETIGTTASTYSSSDVTKWYDDSSPSSFTIDTGPYKVLVVKIQKPTGFSASQQPCCSLELRLDSTTTYTRWPDITPTQADNGSKPLVWMMEDKGSTTSTFAVTTGYSQDRTGWKATHKMENTSGQSVAIMNENNMGCINKAALHTTSGSNTGVKVFDLTGAKTAGYDIYFRILIPNGSSSTNSLSAVRVAFYNRNGSTVSSAISGTVTKDWLLI